VRVDWVGMTTSFCFKYYSRRELEICTFSERETGCSESFLKHSDEAWKWTLVLNCKI
jgi:hypothetical protein